MTRAACFALLSLLGVAAGAATLPDPTAPSRPRSGSMSMRGANADGVLVQAIIGTAAERIAIVNGQLVRAGSQLGGLQVTQVLATGIEYRRNGRLVVAHLPQRP